MRPYPIQVLFREYLEGILAAIFLALFLRFFVLNVLYVPTDNMEPSLVRGDFILGWRLSYGFPLPLMKGERLNFKAPQRGELVSFVFPGDEEQVLIRRVVAVAGDRVSIRDGSVIVNGDQLLTREENGRTIESAHQESKNYQIKPNPLSQMQEITVPEDSFFVLSDNRSRLDDSRDWGVVPNLNVESQVVFIWLSVANTADGLKVLWGRNLSWVQ